MQAEWEATRTRALAELPGRFGFPDLASFVRAVRAAATKAGPKKSHSKRPTADTAKKQKTTAPKTRKGMAPKSKATPSPALPSPAPSEQHGEKSDRASGKAMPGGTTTTSQAEATWPVGTSLDDPKNFGLRPDRAVLERGPLSRDAFQAKLAEALRFATRVLHTSKVPAAVWREWRSFERELHAARQSPSQTP
jgi:hypothetical protein